MLTITIPAHEFYNESTEEFFWTKETTIQLEHSLVSISKWESKWKKPFLKQDEKTPEEIIDYIKCMTITQKVDPYVYLAITSGNMKSVTDYISDPMTATTFSNNKKSTKKPEVLTNELIYYYMIVNNVPMECQKWHLNRLLTLIQICGVKSEKPKKMSKSDIYSQNSALNAARRKKLHTKG